MTHQQDKLYVAPQKYFNKFQRIQITFSMFSNINRFKLEIKTDKTGKHKYLEIMQNSFR